MPKKSSAEFALGRNSENQHHGNNTAAIVGGVVVAGVIAAAIASSSKHNNNSSSGNQITCNSENNGYTRCDRNLRGQQVFLQRQLSNAGCWEGDT